MKRKILAFFIPVILSAISGCASHTKPIAQPPQKAWWHDSEQVKNRVSITTDEFSKKSTYYGEAYGDDNFGGFVSGYVDVLLIRAGTDKNSKIPIWYQVYIEAVATDFRNFTSAIDADGESMEVVSIGRERGGCFAGKNYGCSHELLGVTVSKEYLEKHTARGLRFKLFGQNGNQVVNISAQSIEGFLMALPKQK